MTAAAPAPAFSRAGPGWRYRLESLPFERLFGLGLAALLVTASGVLRAVNVGGAPVRTATEGALVARVWAVHDLDRLVPTTYGYDHPPLAWLQIGLFTQLTGAFERADSALGAARAAMVVAYVVTAVLAWVLARRLGLTRWAAVVAVAVLGFSPLAVTLHRTVSLENVAVPWVLAAFTLACSPRRQLGAFVASGALLGVAVLSSELALLLAPALALQLWRSTEENGRRYVLTAAGAAFVAVLGLFAAWAFARGELVGAAPSLAEGLGRQLVDLPSTGNVFSSGTAGHDIVTGWLGLDAVVPLLGLAAAGLALVALPPLAAPAVAYLVLAAAVVRPGHLSPTLATLLLPFGAVLLAGAAEHLWTVVRTPRPSGAASAPGAAHTPGAPGGPGVVGPAGRDDPAETRGTRSAGATVLAAVPAPASDPGAADDPAARATGPGPVPAPAARTGRATGPGAAAATRARRSGAATARHGRGSGSIAGHPRPVVLAGGALAVAAVAVAVSLPTWVRRDRDLVGDDRDLAAQQAVAWISANVDPDEALRVDPALWADVARAGVSTVRLAAGDDLDGGPDVPVADAGPWPGTGVAVVRAATAAADPRLAGAELLAEFGRGDDRLEVRVATATGGAAHGSDGDAPSGTGSTGDTDAGSTGDTGTSTGTGSGVADGSAPTPTDRPSHRRDLTHDPETAASAGADLARNPRLTLNPAARDQLIAGEVDERVMTTLVALATRRPLAVAAFPVVPGEIEAGLGRRSVRLTTSDAADADAVAALLRRQEPPYRPESVDVGSGGELTVTWEVVGLP